uniref:DUF834 domain-containing protein n=1 Tax=Oryza punctata TaxID=4537 RepID=A0A0E0LM39_ORYPU
MEDNGARRRRRLGSSRLEPLLVVVIGGELGGEVGVGGAAGVGLCRRRRRGGGAGDGVARWRQRVERSDNAKEVDGVAEGADLGVALLRRVRDADIGGGVLDAQREE